MIERNRAMKVMSLEESRRIEQCMQDRIIRSRMHLRRKPVDTVTEENPDKDWIAKCRWFKITEYKHEIESKTSNVKWYR